jgi:protein-S-isoprenylcysteine O-methyltransferase Ste14
VGVLWLRGLIFTLLVPCVVGGLVPVRIAGGAPRGGWWMAGWLATGLGAALYLRCLAGFVAAGGTPAIYFTRPLGAAIGEEPKRVVREGPYRFSRNPMYLGVLAAVFGQAIAFASLAVAVYGAALWAAFHLAVVFLEEPHLRKERGADWEEYARRTPRWLGWRTPRGVI